MSIRTGLAAASAAALCACAPLPVSFYVGNEGAGRLSYNSCSLRGMFEGLMIVRAGIGVLVSVQPSAEDEVVHVRYDLDKGHRAQLATREVVVYLHDDKDPRIGVVDSIDLWDRVPQHGYESLPARRAGLRAPDLLMDDAPLPPLPTDPRPVTPVRHYWMAAHVQSGHAQRLWVKLPDLIVDGAPVAFEPIRFDRRSSVVLAPLNC